MQRIAVNNGRDIIGLRRGVACAIAYAIVDVEMMPD